MSQTPPTSPADAADHGPFDFYVDLLETYLDGELDETEAAAVRARLADEPAYAAALQRLHAERTARAAAFDWVERHEIDADAAGRVVKNVGQSVLREQSRGIPPWAKLVGGMAACVLVGFGLGYAGGFDWGKPPAQPHATPYAAVPVGTDPAAPPQSGWVRYEQGRPVMTLPESAPSDRPLRDAANPSLPRLMPADRTFERPPR